MDLSHSGYESREFQKKEAEVRLCLLVVAAFNRQHATDYDVPEAQWQLLHCAEPADVLFVSVSGRNPTRLAQVVTIPLTSGSDLELRDDNHNVRNLQRLLAEKLRGAGVVGWQIDIHLTRDGELKGLTKSIVGELARLIIERASGEHWTVEWQEIWSFSSELAKGVSDVFGWRLRSGDLIVNAGRGCVIPETRDFIGEGVYKKNDKYRDSASGLILVVGAASTILQTHIDLFRRGFRPSSVYFSEVWFVSPLSSEPVALKIALPGTV